MLLLSLCEDVHFIERRSVCMEDFGGKSYVKQYEFICCCLHTDLGLLLVHFFCSLLLIVLSFLYVCLCVYFVCCSRDTDLSTIISNLHHTRQHGMPEGQSASDHSTSTGHTGRIMMTPVCVCVCVLTVRICNVCKM